MSCTLWARGTGLPLTMATPLESCARDHCGSTGMTGSAPYRHCRGVWFAWRNGRHAAARVRRGW
jgi:hypothetical protein